MNQILNFAARSPMLFYGILLAVSALILSLCGGRKRKNRRQLRKLLRSGEFLSWQAFEENWITGDGGFKYQDTPGCYVILSFKRPANPRHLERYDDIYIGQSIHLCQRVHNHFNGKGNGDIYADIKYGRYVYVSLIPCRQKDLNDNERMLIEAFNATESYNKTRGGAKRV